MIVNQEQATTQPSSPLLLAAQSAAPPPPPPPPPPSPPQIVSSISQRQRSDNIDQDSLQKAFLCAVPFGESGSVVDIGDGGSVLENAFQNAVAFDFDESKTDNAHRPQQQHTFKPLSPADEDAVSTSVRRATSVASSNLLNAYPTGRVPKARAVGRKSTNGPPNPDDIFFLIEQREWKDVIGFLQTFPEANTVSKQSSEHASTATATRGQNLALHEACKHQPPVAVISELLQRNKDAVQSSGEDGFLPLHVACSSQASPDVISTLIEAYPVATRVRDETDEILPLHLAVLYGAGEDVVMELLTTYPEGSVLVDRRGNTPKDYARLSPNSAGVMSTLQTAPLLLIAAQSAQRRTAEECDMRLRGLHQAHQEFVRQLQSHHKDDQTAAMRARLQLQNDLADEKDRNILLAEAFLKLKDDEREWVVEKKDCDSKLETQRFSYEGKLLMQEKELQTMVEGAVKRVETLQEQLNEHHDAKRQLEDLQTRCDELEQEIIEERTKARKKQELADKLQELLDAKDNQLEGLHYQLENNETAQVAISRMEMKKLRAHADSVEQQLIQSNRNLAIRTNRLTSIQNHVTAINFSLQDWAHDDGFERNQAKEQADSSSERQAPASTISPKSVLDDISDIREEEDGGISSNRGQELTLNLLQRKNRLNSSSDLTIETATSTQHDGTDNHTQSSYSLLSSYGGRSSPTKNRTPPSPNRHNFSQNLPNKPQSQHRNPTFQSRSLNNPIQQASTFPPPRSPQPIEEDNSTLGSNALFLHSDMFSVASNPVTSLFDSSREAIRSTFSM